MLGISLVLRPAFHQGSLAFVNSNCCFNHLSVSRISFISVCVMGLYAWAETLLPKVIIKC